MIERNAVGVLPPPVGEATGPFLRAWMSGTAYACGSVRPVNFDPNQSRIKGSRRARTACLVAAFVTLCNMDSPRRVGNRAVLPLDLKEVVWRRTGSRPRDHGAGTQSAVDTTDQAAAYDPRPSVTSAPMVNRVVAQYSVYRIVRFTWAPTAPGDGSRSSTLAAAARDPVDGGWLGIEPTIVRLRVEPMKRTSTTNRTAPGATISTGASAPEGPSSAGMYRRLEEPFVADNARWTRGSPGAGGGRGKGAGAVGTTEGR